MSMRWKQAVCALFGEWWWDVDAPAEQRVLARRVCRQCPVTAECLDYGRTHSGSGTYGGVMLHNGRASRRGRPG